MKESFIKLYKNIRLKPDADVFTIFFIVSLFSLCLGIYNNYQIRNSLFTQPPLVDGQKVLPVKDLIKNISKDAPRIGNEKAKVVMVGFEDFQCPFCKKFHDQTFKQLKKEYIDTGKILFIHQDFAFLGPESNFASEAAHCANDQGKFWEYKDKLYEKQISARNMGNYGSEVLKKIAVDMGLDSIEFNTCFDSGKYKKYVDESKILAQRYGITSTPSFVINGVVVKGAQGIGSFQGIINKELQ